VPTITYPEETLNLLRLTLVPGIGPRTIAQLLEVFFTATSALAASADKLRELPRGGERLIAAIRCARNEVDPGATVQWCQDHDVRIIAKGDAEYPATWASLPDAPPVIYLRGAITASDALAVAIVGARHATQYGIGQSGRFARDLARCGVTVISGLARGIDAAAHRGAMEVGGRTIAILGGGMGKLYPPEHASLADAIAQQGAVLTEYPPLVEPRGPMFPQRNRLISGLSLGVLVIEAADRSGSLITAKHAGEQGREVFALPGPITSRVSRGCHQLIRDGAQLVTDATQILESLGPTVASIPTEDGRQLHQPGELLLNEQELLILESIPAVATSIDRIARQSGLPIHRVLSTISVLEMRRLIRRLSGQYVARI
jgi:DNA processing protein